MLEHLHPATTLAIALAIGVVAQSAARHLRVPGIVLLLLAGVGLGPDGLGWVDPQGLGEGLFSIVDLAVAVILFEGGLNLELSRLRRSQAPIRRLITWGALVTLGGGALAARLWLDWSWGISFLFGSLVVVTGPTVVGPLISVLRLRPRPATVLEAEGLLIDPIGAILAVLVLDVVFAPAASTLAIGAFDLGLRVALGVIAGGVAGYVLARLIQIRRLVPEGFENIFVLAFVLLTFQLCEEFLSHSGILAVTIAGAVVGNLNTRIDRDLREFKDQLTVMLIGLLFVLLAAGVRFEHVQSLGWAGFGVVATLILVVRPVTAMLCTGGSDLTMGERLFIGWVAPRGIVAAAIASIVTATMEKEGMAGGEELRALVFLTIAVTVVLAGLTAGPVGTWLSVRLPERHGYAILGFQTLGLALARALSRGGTQVVVIDSNPQHCRQAEEAGFPTFYGDALKESTQQRAGFDRMKGVIALTSNKNLNGIFVTRARELFHVPECYLAADSLDARLEEIISRDDSHLIFDGPHDIGRWDVRARRGAVTIERWVFAGVPEPPPSEEETAPDESTEAAAAPEPVVSATSATPVTPAKPTAPAKPATPAKPTAPAKPTTPVAPAAAAGPGERVAILTVERGGTTVPMHASRKLEEGDIATIAVHAREREEAEAWLRANGWEPSPDGEIVSESEDDGQAQLAPVPQAR